MAKKKRYIFKEQTAKTLVKVAHERKNKVTGGYSAHLPEQAWFGGDDVRPFEITHGSDDSGELRGKQLKLDGGEWSPSGDDVPLVDLFNATRAIGDIVFCVRLSKQWLLVYQPPRVSAILHFTCVSAKGIGDASVTGSLVRLLQGTMPSGDSGSADTFEVLDPGVGFEATEGDIGKAIGDANGTLWIDWLPCPPESGSES